MKKKKKKRERTNRRVQCGERGVARGGLDVSLVTASGKTKGMERSGVGK